MDLKFPKNFYRVRLLTMRKMLTIYVEAYTKDGAVGVAFRYVTEDHGGKPLFVKVLAIDEVPGIYEIEGSEVE